jgi:pimeloyl-ACP methyl ester carboxylesterase
VSGFAKPFAVPFVHTWFFGARLDVQRIKTKARSWSVIHGEKDPLVPHQKGCELARELGVVCETIKNGGHFTPQEQHVEHPEVLRAILS